MIDGTRRMTNMGFVTEEEWAILYRSCCRQTFGPYWCEKPVVEITDGRPRCIDCLLELYTRRLETARDRVAMERDVFNRLAAVA